MYVRIVKVKEDSPKRRPKGYKVSSNDSITSPRSDGIVSFGSGGGNNNPQKQQQIRLNKDLRDSGQGSKVLK